MRFIGIDPGLATIGIGVLDVIAPDVYQTHEWLTVETDAHTPLSNRLGEIYRDLSAYLEAKKPDVAVIEKIFFAANARTAIDVAQARGVILLAVKEKGISILEPTPLELKSCITGDGQADKIQMQKMLLSMLQLHAIPKPDDAADALALAVYGALQHARRTLIARAA